MPQISQAGLALIERFEGYRNVAYQDQGGVWTIGYGHTGPEVVSGLTCDQEQAKTWLLEDVASAEKAVDDLVEVVLTPNQYAALVSFTFNVGRSALAGSTLLRVLNEGNYVGAAASFRSWVYVDGEVNQGLVNRRAAEQALFLSK